LFVLTLGSAAVIIARVIGRGCRTCCRDTTVSFHALRRCVLEVNSFGGRWVIAAASVSMVFLGAPRVCHAQYIEAFAVVQQMGGDKTTGLGMDVLVDDNVVGGFGAGMNIDGFNLNLDFLFGSATVTVGESKLDTKLFCVDANLDYAPLKGAVSPMVTAGIGSVNFTDSLVSVEELSETDFSYNVGAGLRCAVKGRLLIKGVYRGTWTKIQSTDGSILFDGLSASVGYIF
jgi:opacity protein-like surface antigen